jgi:hypothetical protein
LAEKVDERVNGEDLTMTGHSLGGGLASAAAVATNRPAVTFNAAGLNLLTQSRAFSYTSSTVTYSIEGEVLTSLQYATWWEAFGERRVLKPDPVDVGDNPVTLHSMEVVKRALGI